MQKRFVSLCAVLTVLSLLAAACAPAATPAVQSSPTAPAATSAPQPTTVVEPTEGSVDGDLGSAANPIKMAFVPSGETTRILASGQIIADLLLAETGLYFEVSVPNSYAATIEGMKAGQIDVAWFAPVAYVVARNQGNAELLLTTTRRGASSYPFQIIVGAESGIETLEDLKGKSFAFTDELSASGNLYPRAYLLEEGIDPDKDMEVQYLRRHPDVALAVYEGQVDAGATFGEDKTHGVTDVRASLLEEYPDIYTKTVTLYTSDNVIPNDTVSVRAEMGAELKQRIADGLMALAESEAGLQAFRDLYGIDGFVMGDPTAYDPIEVVAEAAGIDLGGVLRPVPTRAPNTATPDATSVPATTGTPAPTP